MSGPDAVAFDERDDWVVGRADGAIGIDFEFFPGGYGDAVVRQSGLL